MTVRICDVEDMHKSIEQCQSIVTRIFGRSVKYILLRNTTGDYTRMVVSSQDLFNYLQPKCDVLKLMLSFLKNHVAVTMDGGLFTFLMASNLVLKSYCLPFLELSADKKYLLTEIKEFLKDFSPSIDIGKYRDIQSIIKTVLTPKIMLSSTELDHICVLYATAFASTMKKEEVRIIRQNSSKIENSSIYDGFLLPVDNYFNESLVIKMSTLRVCLVDVSVSMDSEEILGEEKERVIISNRTKLKEDVLSLLCKFCLNLSKQADILICQKVVHPKLKYMFKQNNVICVDRIGIIGLSTLKSLFNCKVVSTLKLTDFSQYISIMNDFKFLNLNNRNFLQIVSPCLSKTLFLCADNDEEIDTLSQCFEASMVLLQGLTVHPSVVYGGGCIETIIAMQMLYLRDKQLKVSCTKNLWKVIGVVIKSFLSVAMSNESEVGVLEHFIDDSFHHHWINPKFQSICCCGSISSNNSLNYIPFIELIHSEDFHGLASETKRINLVSFAGVVIHPSEVFFTNLEASVLLSDIVSHISFQISQT